MFKFLAACGLCILYTISFSQGIKPVKATLNFNSKMVGTLDSLELPVHLGNNKSVAVSIRLFGTGFSTKRSTYSLIRGEDTTIWVYFRPEQNIHYDGELFVAADGLWNQRVDLEGKGDLGIPYYQSTFDLWDKDLLAELKKITSTGQRSLGYNGARDEMYGSIDNVSGTVTCAYTARTAKFNSRSGANSNSFNCEHTWPQSKFCSAQSATMKADIHHLFPTDVNSNSQRGNKPFGKVAGNGSWSQGGSKDQFKLF